MPRSSGSDGSTTPIYTVGLGSHVDDAALQSLAQHTGGRYRRINSRSDIASSFDVIADYAGASRQICADLHGVACGHLLVKVDYDWKRGSDVLHGSYDYETNVECADKPKGRVVTVLLTFSNPGISRAVVDRLARQTVAWAAPVDAPRVLVVQDDNHHNEFVDDSEYVHQVLQGLGYVATFLQETATGLTAKDVTGYDLVWFSNPGYPMDSKTTFDTLLAFSAAGGGVVLQGDDMAYSWGENFSMSPLTHVDFGDNGTSACGVSIDNNAGSGSYRVTFEEGTHPIVSGLSGQTFLYGDDIDRSTPRHEGESVLATAVPVDPLGAPLCVDTRPVIVAFDPPK